VWLRESTHMHAKKYTCTGTMISPEAQSCVYTQAYKHLDVQADNPRCQKNRVRWDGMG